MAVIPIYKEQAFGVSPQLPRRKGAVPAEAFGSGQWKFIQRLGETGENISRTLLKRQQQKQKEEDILKGESAFTDAEDEVRNLKNQYLRTQGLDADGITKSADADINAVRDKYILKLDNERQRNYFNQRLDQYRGNSLNTLSRHESAQFLKSKSRILSNRVISATTNALDNNDNPELFNADLNEALSARELEMSSQGYSSVTKKNELAKLKSDILTDSIKISLNKDDLTGAKARFEKEKKNILPEQRARIAEVIKSKEFSAEAQSNTDIIWKESQGNITEFTNLARRTLSGKMEDDVINRGKYRYNEVKTQEAMTRNIIKDDLLGGVRDSLSYEEALKVIEKAPDNKMKVNLEAYAAKRFKALGSGNPKTDKPGTAYDLRVRIDESLNGMIPVTDPRYIRSALQLEAESYGKLTRATQSNIINYYRQGGKQASVTRANIEKVYQYYKKKAKIDLKEDGPTIDVIWNEVLTTTEPGTQITDKQIEKVTRRVIAEGEVEKIIQTPVGPAFEEGIWPGWTPRFIPGADPGEIMSYTEAKKQGKLQNWYPTVSDDERPDIIRIIEKFNRDHPYDPPVIVNEYNIRATKKRLLGVE